MIKKKFVLCINRQYGSGGRSVGKILAKELGIDFYDQRILQITSETSAIGEKYFRKPEDRKTMGDPPYGFKIKKIMLLGNVTETYVKGFSIRITTPMLNSDFRERLGKIIKKNKGTVPLTMYLYDPKTRYNIEFLSRKFQIAISAPFINDLKDMNIGYNVISK